tara:strand:+ start:996 stop:1454 length:459 start_codon:yes stop_codon:yes gene_type:complete
MNYKYNNIYINLVNLTRNKDLYKCLERNDTFSDRLVFFLLHFAFFLKIFKNTDKKTLQNIYDHVFKQLELSIREIGYGDVSINKKMKEYINFFHKIISKIEKWSLLSNSEKNEQINSLLNINNANELSVYFDKYSIELEKNTLNYYTKSVIK